MNERWEYKSNDGSSLAMIRDMISSSRESFGGCVGLYDNGRLVSWVCRYHDGTLGMVYTEEDFRGNGHASTVVRYAVNDVRKRRKGTRHHEDDIVEMTMVSYIVDSNAASRRMYQRLGWRRVADADWAGFASRRAT